MQSVVEHLPSQKDANTGLKRSVELVVSRETVKKEAQAELKRLARKAKMPGFRPGKVPFAMIERNHGLDVQRDVMQAQLQHALDDALKGMGVRIASTPHIVPKTTLTDHTDDRLLFTATFEVYPEVPLPDLKQLAVTRCQTSITEVEVDRAIDLIRQQLANYVTRDHGNPCVGDQVKIDITWSDEALTDIKTVLPDVPQTVKSAQGTVQDFVFVLGKKDMFSEFEQALQRLEVGATTTVEVAFEADHVNKTVAGKNIAFNLTLKEVAQPIFPEMNNELMPLLGYKAGDLDVFKKDIRSNVERVAQRYAYLRTRDSVMAALKATATFDVPQALLEREIHAEPQRLHPHTPQESPAELSTDARELTVLDVPEVPYTEAKQETRLALLCAELVEKKQLAPTPEQIQAQLVTIAQDYESPDEFAKFYLKDAKNRQSLAFMVIEKNIVTHVLQEAQVTDEILPFDQLLMWASKSVQENHAEESEIEAGQLVKSVLENQLSASVEGER